MTSKVLRPRTNAPTFVALDESVESMVEVAREEHVLDRHRALEKEVGRIKHVLVRRFHEGRKTRRWRVIAVPLFIVLLIAESFKAWIQDAMLERAGALLTIAALLYVAYRFRKYLQAAPPVALGKTNCLAFYRSELIRQRDLSKDNWGYLLPFVPGVALGLFGDGFEHRPMGQVVALMASGVSLFLVIAWWNARAARKLQREIDALDAS
ncbi:MAG TPA: hypothetical protein VGF24_01845 [Vicinamibacterales bacterium]